MLNRPGFHTSEFTVAAVNLIVQVALAYNDTITNGTAAKYSLAGAIAYILSRGLAKVENRSTTTTTKPTL